MDTLNQQASDVLSAAKYDWKQSAIHVIASGREVRMNNGPERMINLVKARIKNAMHTAANMMSVDVYSDGALTNQIGGLAHIIQNDGTGTVGGAGTTFDGSKGPGGGGGASGGSYVGAIAGSTIANASAVGKKILIASIII